MVLTSKVGMRPLYGHLGVLSLLLRALYVLDCESWNEQANNFGLNLRASEIVRNRSQPKIVKSIEDPSYPDTDTLIYEWFLACLSKSKAVSSSADSEWSCAERFLNGSKCVLFDSQAASWLATRGMNQGFEQVAPAEVMEKYEKVKKIAHNLLVLQSTAYAQTTMNASNFFYVLERRVKDIQCRSIALGMCNFRNLVKQSGHPAKSKSAKRQKTYHGLAHDSLVLPDLSSTAQWKYMFPNIKFFMTCQCVMFRCSTTGVSGVVNEQLLNAMLQCLRGRLNLELMLAVLPEASFKRSVVFSSKLEILINKQPDVIFKTFLFSSFFCTSFSIIVSVFNFTFITILISASASTFVFVFELLLFPR